MIEWAIHFLLWCFVFLFKYIMLPIIIMSLVYFLILVAWILIDSLYLQRGTPEDQPFGPPLPSRFFGLGD